MKINIKNKEKSPADFRRGWDCYNNPIASAGWLRDVLDVENGDLVYQISADVSPVYFKGIKTK